jgi:hypothetical protein
MRRAGRAKNQRRNKKENRRKKEDIEGMKELGSGNRGRQVLT